METIKEFLLFLKENKKYWLVPVFLVLIFMAGLLYMASGTVVAPFICTRF